MRIVNEFMPPAGGAWASAAHPSNVPHKEAPTFARIVRRIRALLRLMLRRERARRTLAALDHLDSATLRDLGLTRSEAASMMTELAGRVAATRRQTELDYLLSASSRFHVRNGDRAL